MKSYPQCPNVDGLGDGRSFFLWGGRRLADFGGKEGWWPGRFGELEFIFGEELACFLVDFGQVTDAKVGYFDVVVVGEEEVCGFDVAVDDALEVEVFEAEDGVADDRTDLFDVEDRVVFRVAPL
jgi:hypothetical protein